MDRDAHPDYAALAKATRERRLTLGLSINAAAKAAHMSPITWSRVEAGKHVRELTYAAVERVLGWNSDSAAAVLAGGQPTLASTEGPVREQSDGDERAPEPSPRQRFPDDPVLQHLWDTPDPTLTDEQRMAIVQLYLAVKRTADRPSLDSASHAHVRTIRSAM
ncbi:helix-turn-helix domain-containing protein [Nonomuraea recticatena]|uniref:helix-turn-helix domain-containing protein n=1 Tax=Nonomuraea recticatena TaxID=46178 RepID=UPI0031F7CB14